MPHRATPVNLASRPSAFLLMILMALPGAAARLCAQQPCEAPPALSNPQTTLTLHADSQEKVEDNYHLHGHVVATYQDMRLAADEITYNDTTGEMDARGHIVFDDPKGHIEADSAQYNIYTERGWFQHAHGYVNSIVPHSKKIITSNTPYYIRAEKIERLNGDTFSVYHAMLSACEEEHGGWSFGVTSAKVEVGNQMSTHGAIFRFLGFPLFFLPYVSHSIAPNPRHSGFMFPQIGNASQKGLILGEGFFWNINPSADLLVGLENFSLRGLAEYGRFRAKPTEDSQITVDYFGINDQGYGPLRQVRAPGESLDVVGIANNLGDGFRGVVSVDYINSLAFRTTWSDSFNAAVFSEAHQTGFVTKNWDSYSLNIYASRYQDFLSAAPVNEQSIIIRQLPSISLSGMDQPVGTSPFYFAFDVSMDGVGRTDPTFTTPLLTERMDLYPRVTLRVNPFWGFHLTPLIGVRETFYGANNQPGQGPVNRFIGELGVDLRPPSFEKVFDKPHWGHKFKHVIEPDIRYHLLKSPNPENFFDIVRFDQTDVVTQTNELDFSLTNALLWRKIPVKEKTDKKKQESASQSSDDKAKTAIQGASQLLSWQLTQRYFFDPTFGGLVGQGSQVAIQPTLSFSGFAFPEGRYLSPFNSVLKFAPFSNYDTELVTDINPYTGNVLNAGITSHIQQKSFNLAVTDYFIAHTVILPAPIAPTIPLELLPTFNLLSTLVSYGDLQKKGLTGSFRVDYNIAQNTAQDFVSEFRYNFGCFAINAEFQRFNLGFLRNENLFRVSLTLANIATFGNLKPGEPLP